MENDVDAETTRIMNINCVNNTEEMDDVRQEVKILIEEYTPLNTKKTNVSMKIMLTDEMPIFHRPRRLAITKKNEVDKQVEEWLQKGYICPSFSEFASAVI